MVGGQRAIARTWVVKRRNPNSAWSFGHALSPWRCLSAKPVRIVVVPPESIQQIYVLLLKCKPNAPCGGRGGRDQVVSMDVTHQE